MTRQRILQLEYRKQGRCQSCGAPSPDRVHCDRCAHRLGSKSRYPAKSQWKTVDWSLSNPQIAALLNVTTQAVWHQRRKMQNSVDGNAG